jgi:hypothetical protein
VEILLCFNESLLNRFSISGEIVLRPPSDLSAGDAWSFRADGDSSVGVTGRHRGISSTSVDAAPSPTDFPLSAAGLGGSRRLHLERKTRNRPDGTALLLKRREYPLFDGGRRGQTDRPAFRFFLAASNEPKVRDARMPTLIGVMLRLPGLERGSDGPCRRATLPRIRAPERRRISNISQQLR